MTTDEAATRLGIARITARKYAKENNLKRKMNLRGIMAYVWTEKDIKNYRPGAKGRPKNN
jgi:predicted site-specific integrase-resolvase